MKNATLFPLIALLVSCTPRKQDPGAFVPDALESFENQEIALSINLAGGAYIDFHLKEKPVNPFGWSLSVDQMPKNNRPYVFSGHFLCTGRWGAPSQGEIAAGVPHNGEVNTVLWELSPEVTKNGFRIWKMSCKARIEKLDVTREIFIPEKGSFFMVRESFQNNLPVGRLSNVVQHGTIASPFLTENTTIHTNASLGFDQRTNIEHLEDSSFVWPNGKLADGSDIDLEKVTSKKGYVTSHIFDDEIGWITALNPEARLVMGYVWKTSEYPWVNVWHYVKDGKPHVQGLEFGTTGLGQPYEHILEKNVTFFGRHSLEYMDAGETIRKSWICFMTSLPDDFTEVGHLQVTSDELLVEDTSGVSRVRVDGDFSSMITDPARL